MTCRIYIENPPPFKRARRGDRHGLVDVSIEEGIETARFYLDSGVGGINFHHSDLDPYEAKQRAGTTPPERYDSFAYVERLKDMLGDFGGLLVPHRVVVYQTLERQENAFRQLAEAGIDNVVLVVTCNVGGFI